MELFEKVASIVRKNKEAEMMIRPEDRLKEDLGLDSFDTLMIGCDLEDEFHITIDPEAFKGLAIVQEVIDRLEAKIGKIQTV
jgi:acyl carrier protein